MLFNIVYRSSERRRRLKDVNLVVMGGDIKRTLNRALPVNRQTEKKRSKRCRECLRALVTSSSARRTFLSAPAVMLLLSGGKRARSARVNQTPRETRTDAWHCWHSPPGHENYFVPSRVCPAAPFSFPLACPSLAADAIFEKTFKPRFTMHWLFFIFQY